MQVAERGLWVLGVHAEKRRDQRGEGTGTDREVGSYVGGPASAVSLLAPHNS